MKTLLVYADFDWLDSPTLVGRLSYESLRGNDSFGFDYDRNWLRKHANIVLGDDLNNYPGVQFSKPGTDLFGCFSDALPDRWGRTLITRREMIAAAEEGRAPRRLSSFDFLTAIDDFSRMGGFRFRETEDAPFICTESSLAIPPLANIRELMVACGEIEKSEEANVLPEKKWVRQLIKPGTSLGGARPKAGVVDENKVLHVAKFPSRKDDYDVALWEHLCHLLAASSGISVAETKVIGAGGRFHTLLSRRFDRTGSGRRIHFASALTMLGLTDGCNADTGNGYLDIVDFIVRSCCDVEANLRELYRRVVFNICVGNSDDHFRNHGFILTPRGWTLSPAYDINPTTSEFQSLLIDAYTSKADISVILAAAEDYMLPQSEAEAIVKQVRTSVGNWRALASRLCVPQREISLFSSRLDRFKL